MGILNDNPVKYIYILPQTSGYDASEDAVLPIDPSLDDSPQLFRLSATTSFDKQETASTTTSPVSSGANMTDHYRLNDTVISFKGVISDASASYIDQISKLRQTETDPETGASITSFVINYIETLRNIIRSKDGISPLVTIYLPDRNGETNCVITSMKISKDNKVSNGYYVDISAKKIRVPKENTIGVITTTEFREETKTNSTGTSSSKSPVAGKFEKVY